MLCLEVWREKRVEGSIRKESNEEKSRGEWLSPPYLDVFKIK